MKYRYKAKIIGTGVIILDPQEVIVSRNERLMKQLRQTRRFLRHNVALNVAKVSLNE
jgi:hypothetical protein